MKVKNLISKLLLKNIFIMILVMIYLPMIGSGSNRNIFAGDMDYYLNHTPSDSVIEKLNYIDQYDLSSNNIVEDVPSLNIDNINSNIEDGSTSIISDNIIDIDSQNSNDSKKYIVTVNHLNIRQEPSIESNILGKYNGNDTVTVLEDLGEWSRTDLGYISNKYIKEYDENLVVDTHLESIGNFKITAYCPCAKCCGKSDGITASGVKARPNHTIAADTRIIPMGTKVMIDGIEYTVEDVGGGIKNNKIDMFFSSHQEALRYGVKHKEVFVIK